jgi:hypothetical protein
VGFFSKRPSPPLTKVHSLVRPLRSTVVTRFPATVSLSDSRSGPPPRLCIPPGRCPSVLLVLGHPAESPRFLG